METEKMDEPKRMEDAARDRVEASLDELTDKYAAGEIDDETYSIAAFAAYVEKHLIPYHDALHMLEINLHDIMEAIIRPISAGSLNDKQKQRIDQLLRETVSKVNADDSGNLEANEDIESAAAGITGILSGLADVVKTHEDHGNA